MSRLRIGIMLDSFNQPVWIQEMLNRLEESEASEIVAFITPENPVPKENRTKKLLSNLAFVMYKLYATIDKTIFRAGKRDPFRSVEISSGNTSVLPIKVRRTKFRDIIEEDHITSLRNLELDIIVRLGFRILSGEVLKIPKYGIWSYHHADNRLNRGGPAGLWEVINQEPTTGITLQILSEELDGGKILYRGLSKTYPWSWYRNKCSYYWKSVAILPSEIERLARMGEVEFFKSKDGLNAGFDFYTYPLYRKPGNWRMFRFLSRHCFNLTRKLFSEILFEEYWKIGVLDTSRSRELRKSKYLVPPKNTWWADPFYIRHKGTEFIFIESQKGQENGVIKYFERQSGQKEFIGPYAALEETFHLSFPNVFEHRGSIYMLPEASESGELTLYVAESFPTGWRPHQTLLNGRFVDPVIFDYDGKFWLLANKAGHRFAAPADELHIYYTDQDDLTGWKEHPLNPVITEVSKSRNGGQLIKEADGSMYRVSQRIGHRYGEAVKIHRITELSETNYSEIEVSELFPEMSKQYVGLHTLQLAPGLLIYDISTRRLRGIGK